MQPKSTKPAMQYVEYVAFALHYVFIGQSGLLIERALHVLND
jgi:hypothetical protein